MARLDEEVKLLHTHLGGLPRAVEADHVLRQIWIDNVHNSTAIEGNTMTRAQVENLVERRQASASLAESLEVEGYARAADWLYRNVPDYTGVPSRVVSEIHKQVVTLAWQIDPPATRDDPVAWRQGAVRVRSVQVSVPTAIPYHGARTGIYRDPAPPTMNRWPSGQDRHMRWFRSRRSARTDPAGVCAAQPRPDRGAAQ